jgi:protein-arginine kinase activator protein McsA
MVKYAQNLEFEKAAEIRDKIKKIQDYSWFIPHINL